MEKVLDQRRTTYNWVNPGNDSELFIPFRKYKSLRRRETLEKLLQCRLIIDRWSIDVYINENADYTNKKKNSVEVMPIDRCSWNILTRLAEFHDVRGARFSTQLVDRLSVCELRESWFTTVEIFMQVPGIVWHWESIRYVVRRDTALFKTGLIPAYLSLELSLTLV